MQHATLCDESTDEILTKAHLVVYLCKLYHFPFYISQFSFPQTRDRHTCAAFGRPCRIRDEDCDVEPLTEEDFTIDIGFDQSLIPVQREYHVSYVLEMSKLAIIREFLALKNC